MHTHAPARPVGSRCRRACRCREAAKATAPEGRAFSLEHGQHTASRAPVERQVTQKWPLGACRGRPTSGDVLGHTGAWSLFPTQGPGTVSGVPWRPRFRDTYGNTDSCPSLAVAHSQQLSSSSRQCSPVLGAGDLAQTDPWPGPSTPALLGQHRQEGSCHPRSEAGVLQGPSYKLAAPSCGR